jgi:hypothetical protein
MVRKQSPTLASARAYYRLAAKADRAGQHNLADHYRRVADRKVAEDRRRREFIHRMKPAQ